ncbi:hypothetical protein JOF53_002084 [Crossiella equi]|uniref:Uncharacterized protein n=1 Tax=Crossiella equi TaxID=130796 RepID=A0ABS5A9F7_9PSEU|nr:hypothetical protein [Crossiella equi]
MAGVVFLALAVAYGAALVDVIADGEPVALAQVGLVGWCLAGLGGVVSRRVASARAAGPPVRPR